VARRGRVIQGALQLRTTTEGLSHFCVPTGVAGRRRPKRGTQMLAEIFSAYDLIIVMVVLLLVFGGTKLPQLARSLGSAQSEFKKGLSEGDKAPTTEPAADSESPS